MAFERPTLQAIIDRVEGDIKGALQITTILRRSFLGAISRAIAGASHILHGHLVFVSKQIFPDQAEAELLDRWGSIYGIARQPATFAQLTIDVTFTGAGVVPAGTTYQRTDGVTYTLDADIDGSSEFSYPATLQGTVTADEPGDDQNIDVGNTVSLQSPIANVETDATVSGVVVEASDAEEDESYRQRIVDRIQEPPSGGNAEDYKAFARSVSSVTRAWVLPGWLGQGTVGVTFVQDGEDPIIPSPAKVDEVQLAVDEAKPVTANAVVFAPTDNQINMTIRLNPNTVAVQNAVLTELRDLISREAEVRGALRSAGTGTTYTGKISLSRINEAISIAEGEEDHVLVTPTVDAQPAQNGGILTLGTVTFLTLN